MHLLRRKIASITCTGAAAFILVLAAASVAAAQTTTAPPVTPKPTLTAAQQKLLWATVNICDTVDHPDTIGVAGSMPVIKRAKRFYMRFRLQYRDASTETFKTVPGLAADSGWVEVEPSSGRARKAGHDFELAVPPDSEGYTVRAEVSFQWRTRKRMLLFAKRLTTPSHPRTMAADPKRFSAAVCTIKP
ncbi:MAG TPA: hypothetical protein VNT22_09350 [Baekduia sp.]|nr:hypothetical protein [Baekduia sp.]